MGLKKPFRFILLFLLLTSCHNRTLFLSDPVLNKSGKEILSFRIRAFLSPLSLDFRTFDNLESFNLWVEQHKESFNYKAVISSPYYLNTPFFKDMSPEVPVVWLNSDPDQVEYSVYTDWSLLDEETIFEINETINEGVLYIFHDSSNLSELRFLQLKELFRKEVIIEEKKVSSNNLRMLTGSLEIKEGSHIFLLCGGLGPDVMENLAKWDIPFSGEVEGADHWDYPWLFRMENDWKEMISTAREMIRDESLRSQGIPPAVIENNQSETLFSENEES